MRLLAPSLGVLFLVGLIGCGGDGATIDDGSSTDGGSTGGDARLPEGSYSVAFSGSDDATPATNYTGTGSANAVANGTITVNYTSAASGGTTGTTSPTLIVSVNASGVASGSLAVPNAAARPVTGSLATNADGTYLLTVVSTFGGIPAVTETDRFTLTALLPAAGTYTGSNSGTDNRGGTYTGTGTATVGTNGALGVVYTSARRLSGATITRTNTLSAGTLKSDKTFTATLDLGPRPCPRRPRSPARGRSARGRC